MSPKPSQVDYHEFTAMISVIRPKALCFDDGEHDTFWAPRSQILINGERCVGLPFQEGQVVKVSIPGWLAMEKKLIPDTREATPRMGNRR